MTYLLVLLRHAGGNRLKHSPGWLFKYLPSQSYVVKTGCWCQFHCHTLNNRCKCHGFFFKMISRTDVPFAVGMAHCRMGEWKNLDWDKIPNKHTSKQTSTCSGSIGCSYKGKEKRGKGKILYNFHDVYNYRTFFWCWIKVL